MSIIFFDTETTGLLNNSLLPVERQPHIIELFALRTDYDGNELESFQSFFKPPCDISDEITKITGITNEMLVDAPAFNGDILHSVIDFFYKDKPVTLVAHNLKYDLEMVENEWKRTNRPTPFFDSSFLKVCTVEQTEWIKGFRLSLSALHEELFGESFAGAHRAEADVRALAKCYFEARKRGWL